MLCSVKYCKNEVINTVLATYMVLPKNAVIPVKRQRCQKLGCAGAYTDRLNRIVIK